MKRRSIFSLTAILLPFALLALVEIGLRAGSYGYDTHLFVADESDARLMVMNRDISRKYFTVSQNATIGNQDAFYKTKRPGTLRFFVLGASSSLGFPYGHNGAFPRMLRYKLQFAWPDYNIEIINLSLTAINSYTLYDFSKQIVDYRPDAVIVYAGHNEYYGARGVASSSRFGRGWVVRATLAAGELKTVQWLSSLAGRLNPPDASLTDADLTLMERMAARRSVPYGSDTFERGIEQFDDNLGRMLKLYDRHGIPVFIGTLVSNLRNQPPLSREALAMDEFEAGERSFAQGDYAGALKHFTLAREYDALRFRAPEAFNGIIAKYGEEFGNVHLVDIAARFAESSPGGIVGGELLLEHVHPNLEGHRLMAEGFYDAISGYFSPQLKHSSSPVEIFLSDDYPATLFDSIYGEMSIHRLRGQWPFNETPPNPAYDYERIEYRTAEAFFRREINWGEAMLRLNNHCVRAQDWAGALRIVEQMCLELPYEKPFFRQAASLSIETGRGDKAAWYFKKAEQ